MERTTCPFLGLRDDPNTSLNFPSEGNACHRANPIAPVEISHQEQFCLGPAFKACPIYQAGASEPVPALFAAPSFAQDQRKRRLAFIAIPILAAVIVGLGMFLSTVINKMGLLGASNIPDTGASNEASSMGLFNHLTTVNPLRATTATATLTPEASSCTPPNGWVPYLINPTDSLFRLSVVYSVSVEDLQKANCMGSETVLLPGHVIYVPFLPSPTPTTTSTVVVQALPTQLPPSSNNTGPTAAQPAERPPANSPVPPQPPVNTPVPPASTSQPPAQKPPAPKPTDKPKPPPQPKATSQPHPKQEPKPTKTDKPPKKPPKGGGHKGPGHGHGG